MKIVTGTIVHVQWLEERESTTVKLKAMAWGRVISHNETLDLLVYSLDGQELTFNVPNEDIESITILEAVK